MGLATTLLVGGIISAGVSAYGQVRAGRAAQRAGEIEQKAADAQAEVIDWNAGIADLQAEDATARGYEEEHRFRSMVRGVIGTQRAGFAAGNIDVGFGSALDVQADAAFLGELDALTIRNNAAREAWGYKVEGENLRQQADVTREEGVAMAASGRERRNQAYIGAAGTLIGSGMSLVQQRYSGGRRT